MTQCWRGDRPEAENQTEKFPSPEIFFSDAKHHHTQYIIPLEPAASDSGKITIITHASQHSVRTMAFNFCQQFSHGLQLLRLSPSWRCSSTSIPIHIPSATYRSQTIPRLADAHSFPDKAQLCFQAIRRLHTNSNIQDAPPKTGEILQNRKRKGKNALRRVAVEAQRSQEIIHFEKSTTAVNQPTTKVRL